MVLYILVGKEVGALAIPDHIANTDSSLGYTQKPETSVHSTLNAAAATIADPNARSVARGLPYHASALSLTEELATIAEKGKEQWQALHYKQQAVTAFEAGETGQTAYNEHGKTLDRNVGIAAASKKNKQGKRVRNSSAVMIQQEDGEIVTLTPGAGFDGPRTKKV